MSRTHLRDWSELAEEQGWRVLSKPGGKWVFYPPAGTVPPDLRVLNVAEPPSDQYHSYDNIRALLKRAGLKFPEDLARERKQTSMAAPNGASNTPKPVTRELTLDELVEAAHQDINAAVDSLSRLGEKLGKIQGAARASTAGYDKLRALAQALKEI